MIHRNCSKLKHSLVRLSFGFLAAFLFVVGTCQAAFATAMYDATAMASLEVLTNNPYVTASSPFVDTDGFADITPGSDASASASASASSDTNNLRLGVNVGINGSTGTTGLFAESSASALASFDLLFDHEVGVGTNCFQCDDSIFVTLAIGITSAEANGSVDNGVLESASAQAMADAFRRAIVNVSGQTSAFSLFFTLPGSIPAFETPLQLFAGQPVTITVSVSAEGQATVIPEPATLLLLGASLLGAARVRRKLV